MEKTFVICIDDSKVFVWEADETGVPNLKYRSCLPQSAEGAFILNGLGWESVARYIQGDSDLQARE
jgi:hypothetical protein